MVQGLLWLIAFLLTLFFAILLLTMLPYHYCLQGVWQESLCAKIDIKVGFFNKPLYSWKIGKKRKETEGKKRGKSPFKLKKVWALLKHEFSEELWETTKVVIRHAVPGKMEIRGKLGFSDPYYTGLFAAGSSLIPDVNVKPVFTGPVRDITFHLEGRVIPLWILYKVLSFICFYQKTKLKRKIRNMLTRRLSYESRGKY